jgi:hypothetical protein
VAEENNASRSTDRWTLSVVAYLHCMW